MIIDKLNAYRDDEYFRKLDNLHKAYEEFKTEIEGRNITKEEKENELEEMHKGFISVRFNLEEEIKARYKSDHTKKEIMADVKEALEALEKEDFQGSLKYLANQINPLGIDDFQVFLLQENYERCYSYVYSRILIAQTTALKDDEASLAKIRSLIDKKVSQWYIKPTPAYLPIAHGRPTDAIAFANTKDIKKDPVSGTSTIKGNSVELILKKLEATLTMNTDKLLSYAMYQFTKQNDFRRAKKTKRPNLTVTFPLKEYAKLLGIDVEEHETATPEEAEKEKKRAKNQLDNFRKKIKKQLDDIYALSLNWKEFIRGKEEDFEDLRIIYAKGIRKGQIKISFTPEIANYLITRNTITPYPTKLLGISGNQPTAYRIGRKLAEHYNIDNNQIRGTYNRLSIPKILDISGLPSYDELIEKKHARHWEERIKEPLEKALEVLIKEKILESWKYTHAKGIDLTDDEAYNIDSYDKFSKLYLQFEFIDKIDHTERIEARRESANKKTKGKGGRS